MEIWIILTRTQQVLSSMEEFFSSKANMLLFSDKAAELPQIIGNAIKVIYQIGQRLLQDNFYLGVIGEFSCGKSTFINALIEQESLVEDINPGTTASKTVIAYSAKESVTIMETDGNQKTIASESSSKDLAEKESIAAYLKKFTTGENEGARIKEVIWNAPIDILKNGLRIVDTPGIGALNSQHTQIAKNAAVDCDALLVLTPLDTPLSKNLLETIKIIAGTNAEKCIFIGTKKDLLPAHEENRMKKFFYKRLKSWFNRDCKFEFVSAYQALRELDSYGDRQENLNQFRKFGNKLLNSLEARHMITQARKAAANLGETIEALLKIFDDINICFSNKILELNKLLVPEDKNKWLAWHSRDINRFEVESRKIKTEAKAALSNMIEGLRETCYESINYCSDAQELKSYLQDRIQNDFNLYIKDFKNLDNELIKKPFIANLKETEKSYQKRFVKEYRKLKNAFSLFIYDNKKIYFSEDNLPEDIGYDCIDQLVADMKKEENFKMGGGLAAGLGLSLMIPGAGWLLGGALALGGLALGAFSLKSLNDRKDDAMRQIDIVIKNFERELAALLNSSYLQSKTQYLEVLKDSLISQKKAYAKNIKKYNQKIGQDGMCLKQAASFLNTHIEQLQKIGKDLAEWQEKSVFVQEEENGNES